MNYTLPLASFDPAPYFYICLNLWKRISRLTTYEPTFHGRPGTPRTCAVPYTKRGGSGTYAVDPPGFGDDRGCLHKALTGVYRVCVGGTRTGASLRNERATGPAPTAPVATAPTVETAGRNLSNIWILKRTTAPAPTAPAGGMAI
jgi:hypothetical protein